jgi:hypothetical protein
MGESGEAVGRASRLKLPLADPRRYGTGDASNPLLRLAEDGCRRSELTDALRELAARGDDVKIGGLLAVAPSQLLYTRLWRALCDAVEKPRVDAGVAARVFAIPWVIVCTAGSAATLTCVLPDVAELARVLEANGVFGGSRNLGLGNALVSIETLERLRPSEILEWSQSPAVRDVPPAEIHVARGLEEVHVRLLLGASVAAADAPGIVETGSNIGVWGTPALRAMTAQLATAGVQILPMPRPPSGVYSAAYAGRRSGVEAAFNLFMSNGVRRFRSIVGDPHVTLSSHAGGELRVTLSNPLEDTLVEGFRWPLHPADDLAEIERTLTSMIWECRLAEPHFAPGVLPDYSPTGAVLYPRV